MFSLKTTKTINDCTMGDSLPAINVDQLTDSVNNAVHGNMLPPLALLPPPPAHPPPSSVNLPTPGFPDGSVRLLPTPGLPPLPVFRQLSSLPLQAQASGSDPTVTSGNKVSSVITGNADNLDNESPHSAPSVSCTITSASATTSTVITSACSSASSNSSSTVVSSSSFPLPQTVSMPSCPPMFIMFSLRLPASDPLAQGGGGEAAGALATGPPGPRLPPFPPFPLFLPFLPPSQDGCPQRPLLPLSDFATSAAPSSLPSSLPLPPGSFPQGLPLPPLPLQLPASLPLLPLPPQSSTVTQGDFSLPPLLLQPPATVSGSLPLPPLLPPPSSNLAQFPCPPSLCNSAGSEGQSAPALPPFPPRSYATFVQSGVPLTSLATSSRSLPSGHSPSVVFEGNVAPQQEVHQTAVAESKSEQNMSTDVLEKARQASYLVETGTASAQTLAPLLPPLPPPPPAFPLLPPLPTSSAAAQGFPLLPPLSIPSQASCAPEAGFPLHVSIPLPPPPPLPFSLPVGSGSFSQPPPSYVSVASQPVAPPFVRQPPPPFPFPVEPLPPPPTVSSALSPDNQHVEAESSTAAGCEDEPETEKNTDESSDGSCSHRDNCSVASASLTPEVHFTQEEAMCIDDSNDNQATLSVNVVELGMNTEEKVETLHPARQMESLYNVTDSHISAVCPIPSENKAVVLPSQVPHSSSKSSSVQLCSLVEHPGAGISDVRLNPTDCGTVLRKSVSCTTVYSSAVMSVQDPCCVRSESSQGSTVGKPMLEMQRPLQGLTSSEPHLPTSSLYQMDLGGALPPLHFMQERQHPCHGLPSCALERQAVSHSQPGGVEPVILHPASPHLSTGPLPHEARYAPDISIEQQDTPRPAMPSVEGLSKPTQLASVPIADSCQFHNSLTSLASEFPFPAPSGPTLSVDPPSQTLLPSVGYSPPGLSNHGLSPNLFSPISLAPADQNTAGTSREDTSVQVVVSAAVSAAGCGTSGMDMGAGLSTSVLDMLLLKADLSSVEIAATTGEQGNNAAALQHPTTAASLTAAAFPARTLKPQLPSTGVASVTGVLPRTAVQSQVLPSFSSPTAMTVTPGLLQQATVVPTATVPAFTAAGFPMQAASVQSLTTSSTIESHSLTSVSNAEAFSTTHEELIPVFTGQFCLECNKVCNEMCKHGSMAYQRVSDTPVLTRARATLPACLKLGHSSISGHFNTTGVFAKTALESKIEFGPLQGKLLPFKSSTDSAASFSMLKIFYNGSIRVLDISDENESNWMMFVKPARSAVERNIVVFQRGHEIMFITSKEVQPDMELLFWFAPDYCKMLCGVNKPPALCPYCAVCSQVFFDRSQLRRHCKQVHEKTNVLKWSCTVCCVQFRSAGRLNAHVMTQHMNLKPYSCPTCGKEFADPRNLKTHLVLHTGIKKFGCDICGKHFTQKAHLQSHHATHTKVKAAQCKYCSKRFARMCDMRQHELKHTKAQTHHCQQCSKTFHRAELLRRHMKSVHNNERNYMCEHCSKMFHTKYKLMRHAQSCKGIRHQPASSSTFPSLSSSTLSSQPAQSSLASESINTVAASDACLVLPCRGSVSSANLNIAVKSFAVSAALDETAKQGMYCSGERDGESIENSVILLPSPKGGGLTVATLPLVVNSAN